MATSVEAEHADYAACVLGLRDYVNKNGFPGVVLGLSGGIDSALCAAMAVDALGPERVRCVMLPYKFTAQESLDDAAACAKALGVRYEMLPIAPAVEGLEKALAAAFTDLPRDVTEENIQLIEALCDKFGKTHVRVKDVPGDTGFVGNRVFRAARNEARKIVEDGICTAEGVDTIMMGGYNWPAGPIGMSLGARAGWGQKK